MGSNNCSNRAHPKGRGATFKRLWRQAAPDCGGWSDRSWGRTGLGSPSPPPACWAESGPRNPLRIRAQRFRLTAVQRLDVVVGEGAGFHVGGRDVVGGDEIGFAAS